MVDKTLQEIKQILTKQNKTLMTAESCTGGLISSKLTDISGSSCFTKSNFVTYSNEAKTEFLGVGTNIIEKYGVVSKEVAHDMAKGLIEKYDSDYAISTTGVLGPKLYDDGNPKGTVFIGFASKNKNQVIKYQSKRLTRGAIKRDIVRFTLKSFLEFLKINS